ncbi:MAG: tetratricopeptide repeat protein [Gammaproteobacteria bacterium]|nr:MAG: tetratricopeptide repeat protein [Gammaproteobacteria bacterium]
MSLLLDALKKAAEQKAEINRESEAGQELPDETELLDQTTTKIASESELTDHTRSSSQSDTSENDHGKQGDDGHILGDDDESITGSLSEDKTQVVSDDETLEFSSDKTQVVSDDETLEFSSDKTQVVSDDETLNFSSDRTEVASGDETLEFSYKDLASFREDSPLSDPESGDIGGPSQDSSEDETIFDQSGDADDPADADPSVSLFDGADTLTSAEAASQVDTLPGENALDMTPAKDATKSLNLVDIPDRDNTEGDADRLESADGITTAPAIEHYPPRGEGTSTLMDSTSTRTFAPDNYDRTLHKPLNDGASSLFAGLKSDSGVVMTPEYAKKMFLNKSSSLRMQNLRIYGGIGLSILMVIVIFGVFEIDRNSSNIDDSLRPLKRDPMPGLIRNTTTETFTNVFAAKPGSEVDATTLQLVENAELIADSKEVVAIETGNKNEALVEDTNVDQIDPNMTNSVEVQQASVAKVETTPGTNISLPGVSGNGSAVTNSINIISKSTISAKDRWLHEAYAAYQKGDDQLALVKYNAVLDIDPDNRNALLARAAINIQNNRIAEAIRDYRRILFVNPKDSIAMSSMIAVANFSPEQSETQLKLMIRDEPDSHYLNFTLGNIFGAQNRWQEAQKKYFTALENNPHDPNYAYNLAVSLEHIAKPQVAIAYYELALNNYTRGLATFSRDVVDARLEILRQL